MAKPQAPARPRDDPCALPVVALRVDARYAGFPRPEWKSQRNRFSSSLHFGLAGDRTSRRRLVQHECPGSAGRSTCAGAPGLSIPAAVSTAGVDFCRALRVSVVRVGADVVVGLECWPLRRLLL